MRRVDRVDRAHVDVPSTAPGADHQGRAPGSRSPGQTGHRPARPLAPCRDPVVLARVLYGLHGLPDA